MLTLIHSPRTRSGSIRWLLEEIGAPYAVKTVTFRKADGTGSLDPNNPHPHGKVPALLHDGDVVFEGAAIAVYLTDLFPDAKMGPRPGEAGRGAFLSWLAYRPGIMEPALMARRMNVAHVYGAMPWAPAAEVEEVLNAHLAKHTYFLGSNFSAADVMLGGGINSVMSFGMMAATPVLKDYCSRLTSRPAYKRMMELDADV